VASNAASTSNPAAKCGQNSFNRASHDIAKSVPEKRRDASMGKEGKVIYRLLPRSRRRIFFREVLLAKSDGPTQ